MNQNYEDSHCLDEKYKSVFFLYQAETNTPHIRALLYAEWICIKNL